MACQPGQVSATGSTSSDDCFDEFTSIAPYDYITTPVSAWTVLLADATSNHTASALDCRDACRTEPRCQYFLFKAGQDDHSSNGCSLKLMPRNHATDTFTAFKLGVGDYTIWEVRGTVLESPAVTASSALQHEQLGFPHRIVDPGPVCTAGLAAGLS